MRGRHRFPQDCDLNSGVNSSRGGPVGKVCVSYLMKIPETSVAFRSASVAFRSASVAFRSAKVASFQVSPFAPRKFASFQVSPFAPRKSASLAPQKVTTCQLLTPPSLQTTQDQTTISSTTAPDSIRAPYSELLRLAFWEGLSNSQIAERLKITVGGVRQRMHRAQKMLRPILQSALEINPGRKFSL